MLEDLRLYKEKKIPDHSECRDLSSHTEASPASEGTQGLLATGFQGCKVIPHNFSPEPKSEHDERLCSREEGGNRVFAVLIETSVANPRRNAGRQNVAQC